MHFTPTSRRKQPRRLRGVLLFGLLMVGVIATADQIVILTGFIRIQ